MGLRRALLSLLAGLVVAGTAPPSALAVPRITEFTGHGLGAGSQVGGIVTGPDGNVWFTDMHAIGRITPSGKIREFSAGLPVGNVTFGDIVAGADGNLWFIDHGTKQLGRITPSGKIREFGSTDGLLSGASPSLLASGSDNNVWFVDAGTTPRIGKITPSGAITEFTSTLNPMPQINAITLGTGGDLWFTDEGSTPAIGRVTPAGVITELSSGLPPSSFPDQITMGPDGNMWFTDELTPAIGKVTPDGTITEFGIPNGLQANAAPDAIIAGPDGNVWFTDQYSGQRAIGRITRSGAITEFHHNLSAGLPDDIALGADGKMYVEQAMPGGIAQVTPSGAITEFTAGLKPGAGQDGDTFTSGGDGNLWFFDNGTTRAIGRVSLGLPPRASTGGARAITTITASVTGSVTPLGSQTSVSFQYGTTKALGSSARAGSLGPSIKASRVAAGLAGLRSGTRIFYRVVARNATTTRFGAVRSFRTVRAMTTSASIGNQHITITSPRATACTAKAGQLLVGFRSATVAHGTRLHFSGARFYFDHRHGVLATLHHARATVQLPLLGLGSGLHTLVVRVSYQATTVKLSVKFRVC